MKTARIHHGEYFIDLERNAYSWRIVAITHHPSGSFLPLVPAFFYPDRTTAEQYARAAIDNLTTRRL
jgi:hypothetical protein